MVKKLLGALSEDILMQVSSKKTAKEVWDSLKTRFVGADRVKATRLSTLRGEFDKLCMADEEPLDAFAGKISGMAARYASLGATLGDAEMVKKLLDGEMVKKLLGAMLGDAEEALGRLKAFDERSRRRAQAGVGERNDGQLLLTADQWEARRLQHGGGHDEDDGGSSVASGARGRRGKCHNCGICGHFARDCRQPRKEKALLVDIDDEPALL
uniref:Uncharacterized protein n=1 Tax=Avena sativa TaxID=4498 RepID=A0ACD5WRC0_AVESA